MKRVKIIGALMAMSGGALVATTLADATSKALGGMGVVLFIVGFLMFVAGRLFE